MTWDVITSPPDAGILTNAGGTTTTAQFETEIGKVVAGLQKLDNALGAQLQQSFGGLRNRIMNGNFAVNQLALSGTVTLSAGQYGHDQWKAGASGCTYTFVTSGIDTIITITAGSLQQVIEGSYVEGGDYTLSWVGTATASINGGTAAASPLTATGLTAGSNATVEFGVGSVGKVQFEPGDTATTFERSGIELYRCQRYYEVGNAGSNGYNVGGGGLGAFIQFSVPKYATPTVTHTNVSKLNCTISAAADVSIYGFRADAAVTSTGAAAFYSSWTASARL